ncbi:MAG TPA: alpha/beta fold hydrolase, partial [Paraburkholderia sp.]|nr:alpha/beta fold hydrolase [Paraburkholderia sp.]
MPGPVNTQRRRLLGGALAGIGMMEMGLSGVAHAQSSATRHVKTAKLDPAFDSVKQIDAGALNIGYVDAGPRNGPVVVLLHGWPYDIHSFAEVTPHLTAAGYRVIVPYLRGYGSTRFLSADTPR